MYMWTTVIRHQCFFYRHNLFSQCWKISVCLLNFWRYEARERARYFAVWRLLEFLPSSFQPFFFFFFFFALEAIKRSVIAAKEYYRADRCAVCYLCIIPVLMYNMAPPHPLPPNSLCPFSLLLGMLPESNRNMPQLRCGLEQPGLCLQCSGRNLAGHPPLWKGGYKPNCCIK